MKKDNELKDAEGYFRNALRISGFTFDNKKVELILCIVELVNKKKGQTSLKDIVQLTESVDKLFITDVF